VTVLGVGGERSEAGDYQRNQHDQSFHHFSSPILNLPQGGRLSKEQASVSKPAKICF
jgi:hypothetical protein